VYVSGENEDGDDVRFQYPVTIEVTDSTPLVGINTQPATAGNDTRATVTVANGQGSEVRNVGVTLSLENGTINTSRQVASRLPTGAQRTFDFTLSSLSTGNHSLEATVTYETSSGATRSLLEQSTLRVRSPQPQGEIALTEVEIQDQGGQVRITGSASNTGLSETSGVVLRTGDTDTVNPRSSLSELLRRDGSGERVRLLRAFSIDQRDEFFTGNRRDTGSNLIYRRWRASNAGQNGRVSKRR